MSEYAERLRDLLLQPSETPNSLDAEEREQIANLFDEADEDDLVAMSAAVQRVLQEQPGSLRALYARATAQELAGDNEAAGNVYLQIAQALATQHNWSGVLALALHAMPLTGDYRLVRLMRRAGETGKLDLTAAMEIARAECTDSPDLLWEQSQEADAQGDSQQAVNLALQALEGYITIKEQDHAADPLLRVLEADDEEVYRSLLGALRRMARGGLTELLSTALELAEGKLLELQMAPELAEALASIMERRPELTELRPLWAKTITRPLGDSDNIVGLIKETGLDNPAVPLEDALAAFREAAAFSPGAYVGHRSWGVGVITANEGNELTVDFAEKPGHKIALEMAKTILTPLAKDSLQVQRHVNLEGLQEEAATNPAEIVCRLIGEASGEIVTPDIKMRLIDWLIPEHEWSSWWKKARKALEADPRVDCSQAFQHIYREAHGTGEVGVPLPNLDPRKGVKGAVSLIGKLLAQHPDAEGRASNYYTPELEMMLRNSNKVSDWARALPLLIRWHPERAKEWQAAAERTLPGASLTLGATVQDQEALLDVGLQTRSWKYAAFEALASRFAPVKEKGLQALKERSGDDIWADFTDLLLSGGHYPEKMAVAEMVLHGELTREGVPEGEPVLNPWYLLHAALSVVSSKKASAGRGAAHRLLRPGGHLARLLKETELDERTNDYFDIFRRQPIEGEVQLQLVTFLEDIGRPEMADEILRFRRVSPEDQELLPELDPRITLMTRQTFKLQTERLREMERQLADEIPNEIAKARALGDLSENAEYHAARERQGITKALYDQLSVVMETAAVIEDLHRQPHVAGVGTEVRLRDLETDEEQVVWILGEGDSQYGHEVVSYKAPLGQALIGKREHDKIEMENDNGGQRYEVVSVEPKLPEYLEE